MQVSVTPQYVNEPKKPGGKYGNIKTAEGAVYFVPVAQLGMFQPGTPANINVENQTWGQNSVQVVTGMAGQAAPAQQMQQAQAPVHAANVTQPVGMSKDETITRLAIAKSCIEAGKTFDDANRWLVWVEKRQQQPAEPQMAGSGPTDLNDSIPFAPER